MANTYQLGDEVQVSGTFVDSAGDAIDPTDVYCQVRDPSGNITTYEYGVDAALVKDDTGEYHVDVDVDEVGWWWYRFYGTGTGQAADEERFRVEESVFD